MRSVERTKSLIYAAHIASQTEGLDEDSNPTGDIATTYSTPVAFKATHQPITNALTRLSYGLTDNSLSRIVFAKDDPISFTFATKDVVWIGVTPNGTLVDSSAMNHTHTVETVMPTGEQTVVTIKKRSGL